MHARQKLLPSLLVACLSAAPEVLAGDKTVGEGVFANRCRECHEAPAGDRKAGPSLVGIVGRRAGSLPGFAYSDAMRNAGFVWTELRLQEYLSNPKAAVPGNRMLFNGLKREGEFEDLLEYLKSLVP